jgi:hypothetical protein
MPTERLIVDDWTTQKTRAQRRTAPSEQDRLANEERRLARRAETKAQISEARLNERRAFETDEAIRVLEEKKEVAAAEHCAKAEPWQQELREIEQAQLVKVRAHEDLDPVLESRRKELLENIRCENECLQSFIESQDRLIAALYAERLDFAKKADWVSLQTDLIRDFADPVLRSKLRVTQRTVTLADNRVRYARDVVGSFRVGGDVRQISAAEEELAEAERLLQVAQAELETVTQAALNE